MRIAQIIDSLESGGAERMAVNYANALESEIEFSGIVVTRKEGVLLNQISPSVSYLFLNKKRQIDFKALFTLRSYVLKNKITHIHAHSTSFFLAFLLKLTLPRIKIIRHDHYGQSEFLETRPHLVLKLTAFFFNGVIVVNQNLKRWSEKKIKAKNVVYFPNFAVEDITVTENTVLNGLEGKRIICLANLRAQKNHALLLEVAQKLSSKHPDWSFHLVGKDFEDNYSKEIKQKIYKEKLNNVFVYGSRQDISNVLNQATIGVLVSKSEGLPVALLEYGQFKKPVIVTNVGEIPFVIEHRNNGLIVPDLNAEIFYDLLIECIENSSLRIGLGDRLFETISDRFSKKTIIKKYLNWLHEI